MNINRLIEGLPVIGYGLLGVFAVIGLIALSVILLTHIFKSKNRN